MHLNWSYYYCCFFWPSCWIAYPSLSHAFYLSLFLLPFPLPIPFPFPASFSPLTYPFLSAFPYLDPCLLHCLYPYLLLCLYRPFYLSSFCLSPCCHQNHYCLFSSLSYAPWLSQPSDPYPSSALRKHLPFGFLFSSLYLFVHLS